ncbi:hypothetical protein [Collimonas fungivorans]|uniref:hypothetical protein n=1 Tax=Collimonas fungivorans TaxID=158899 RepID=UPI00030BBC19|nr:hypothetical protein [Collimonas fungivorans]
MTIKTLLGMSPNSRNNSGSSWTFGWTPSQASTLSANTKSGTKHEASQGERQVGVYGVLATRNHNGR